MEWCRSPAGSKGQVLLPLMDKQQHQIPGEVQQQMSLALAGVCCRMSGTCRSSTPRRMIGLASSCSSWSAVWKSTMHD
jgi:hypothetical protein